MFNMDFNQLCDTLHVTPEERKELIWFLAMFRARKTIEVLSSQGKIDLRAYGIRSPGFENG